VIGLVPLGLLRWRIDVMTLGDEEATALGVSNAGCCALFVIAAATLMTSAASRGQRDHRFGSVSVVPHLTRLIVGACGSRV